MKESRILIALIVVSILLRVIFFDTSYFFWDESVYMIHGQKIAGLEVGYDEMELRPPLLPILIAPFSGTQFYETAATLIVILLNSLVVIPVYYLGKMFSKKTAVISAIIMALIPVSIIFSRQVMTDHLGMVLALASFVLFLYGTRDNKTKLLVIGSVLLALSVMMKFTNLLMFVVLLPPYFFLLKEKRWKQALIADSAFLIAMLPFLIYNLVKYGSMFHMFSKAWIAVTDFESVNLSFLVFLFNDTFGLLFIILALAGIVLLAKSKIKFRYSILFAFFVILLYFLRVINIGVAKPPTIEWEAARFMLLLVPFIIVFAVYYLTNTAHIIGNKKHETILISLAIVVALALLAPQYIRAYTPKIEFEAGLRDVTKEAALFLKETDIMGVCCKGNCPPIAYYSDKMVDMFFDEEKMMESHHDYLVTFEEKQMTLVEKFCEREKCAYIYAKESVFLNR